MGWHILIKKNWHGFRSRPKSWRRISRYFTFAGGKNVLWTSLCLRIGDSKESTHVILNTNCTTVLSPRKYHMLTYNLTGSHLWSLTNEYFSRIQGLWKRINYWFLKISMRHIIDTENERYPKDIRSLICYEYFGFPRQKKERHILNVVLFSIICVYTDDITMVAVAAGRKENIRSPFYSQCVTLIPAWISNYIRHEVCDEITYDFQTLGMDKLFHPTYYTRWK